MSLVDSKTAPYAPADAIVTVIDTHRERTLPKPVTVDVLMRCGVSESLAPRTLKALKLLDLINADGNPTPTFDKFKQAPTEQYQSVLADWLRDVYKPVFDFVDPTSDVQRIVDQFRTYEPSGQRNRMVTLFLGLCVKAGLLDKEPPMPRRASAAPAQRLNTTNGNSSGGQPKPTETGETLPTPPPPDRGHVDPEDSSGGRSYNVTLRSGGTVALSVAVDLFELDEQDRTFVFELVDKIKAYRPEQEPDP